LRTDEGQSFFPKFIEYFKKLEMELEAEVIFRPEKHFAYDIIIEESIDLTNNEKLIKEYVRIKRDL